MMRKFLKALLSSSPVGIILEQAAGYPEEG
jgi:hypothetical protein